MAGAYEYEFDPDATNDTAASLFRIIRSGGPRVLDLGSGPGIVASALVASGHTVVCVDTDAESLAAARRRGVEHTVEGDLSGEAWISEVDDEPYDTIVMADVLEHLVDPGALLDRIRASGLLAEGGQLAISVPNIAHESVIGGLILGRFRYTTAGLLDRTHVHFFTRSSLLGLLESHGYVAARLLRTERTIEQTEQFATARDLPSDIRVQLRGVADEPLTYQFIVEARAADAAGHVAALRQELIEERDRHVRSVEDVRRNLKDSLEASKATIRSRDEQIADLEARLATARSAIERLEGELESRQRRLSDAQSGRDEEVESLHEELARATRELAAARGSLATALTDRDAMRRWGEDRAAEQERLRRHLRSVEDRLDLLLESTSFSIGWKVTAPLRRLRGGGGEPVRPPRLTDPSRSTPPPVPLPPEPSVPPIVDAGPPRRSAPRRAAYDAEVSRERFSTDARGIVFLCSTTDLDAGRGDVFAATGLGLAMREHGWEAVYRSFDRWDELPTGTTATVSMLAEQTMLHDPASLPPDVRRIAWIRNNTDRWIERGSLALYDAVFCSSEITADAVRAHYSGPVHVVPIAVDPELFTGDRSAAPSSRVVSTINQWGKQRRTFAALAELGPSIDLHLYGRAANLDARLQFASRGLISYFEIPSVYQAAAIVLDDQQGVNAPFGNVNSRIYESIAAGALPVTASPLGLAEVGLGDVPSWRDPAELAETLRRWLGDGAARERLLSRLREVVLSRHTWAHRAADVVRIIDDTPRRTPTVIGFSPDYRITNPFQDMVYSASGNREIRPVARPAELADAAGLSDHPRVFHLHWVAPIIGPAGDDEAAAAELADAFLAELDRARSEGVGFVWTVHNVLHHEARHVDVEVRLRKGLAERADLVHVMSERTLDEVADAGYSLPADRVIVGTHPSYVGVYPDAVSRAAARRELGVPQSDFVYLALGQIRPYKGLERLLDAFEGHRRRSSDARLLVAGKPGRFRGVEQLLERARDAEGVVLVAEHVDDVDLQVYLRAADVVVLPHRRVLNSGLLWLAWSFARPVVAPRTGALQDLVTEDVGLLFDSDVEDLAPTLERARSLTRRRHGRAAFEKALANTPRSVSAELLGHIDRVSSQVARPDR